MKNILLICFLGSSAIGISQNNILITNPEAEAIVHGNYTPSNYQATTVIDSKTALTQGINDNVNADSLMAYIVRMGEFNTRNTGSDTVSTTSGIGAARRWAYDKFLSFSAASENRLIVSYLQFDQDICAMAQHRNIFAVLPGRDTSNHQVIIIEGHFDSRCDVSCDTACLAQGMEDNATGSALVLELARVMSKYTYNNTIVFMLTIGEEQGLYGANAFSQYSVDNSLPIKAVFNNDVVGGVICGQTSSAPSCPGLNDVDSLAVRLFSKGSNTQHKQLARYTKLQYKEELLQLVTIQMAIHIMSAEDRTGRGGDHIPFREDGFTAIRTTSANEHGDASNAPGYSDRQHTSDDILGIDTNGDQIIDSFFVDFNYLGRNAVINGVASAMVAIGPRTPDFQMISYTDTTITLTITTETQYPQYRMALRTVDNDWDTVYTTNNLVATLQVDPANWNFLSVASVDSSGVESLFSNEVSVYSGWLETDELDLPKANYELLQNRPNPFDESTIISVHVTDANDYKRAEIVVRDFNGSIVKALPIDLNKQLNDVVYEHGYGATGIYSYSLVVDGIVVSTKRMIFAN
ncbi:MAG: M28 family peptidase [Crocinitomicaceae bacterium]|nr:M28 family peptidase [Crocinitomicaceae bacterium]